MTLDNPLQFSIDEDLVLLNTFIRFQPQDLDEQLIKNYMKMKTKDPILYSKEEKFLQTSNILRFRLEEIFLKDSYLRTLLAILNNVQQDFGNEDPIEDDLPLTEKELHLYLSSGTDQRMSSTQLQEAHYDEVVNQYESLRKRKYIQLEETAIEIQRLFDFDVKPFIDEFKNIANKTLDGLRDQVHHLRNQTYQYFIDQNERCQQLKEKIINFERIDQHLEQKLQKYERIYNFIFQKEYLPQLLITAKAMRCDQLISSCYLALAAVLMEPEIQKNYQLNECDLITEADFKAILRESSDSDVFSMLQSLVKDKQSQSQKDLSVTMLKTEATIPPALVAQEAVVREQEVRHRLQLLSFEQLQAKKRDEYVGRFACELDPLHRLAGDANVQIDETGQICTFLPAQDIQTVRSTSYYKLDELPSIDAFVQRLSNGNFIFGIESRSGIRMSISSDGVMKSNKLITDLQFRVREQDALSLIVSKKHQKAQVFVNGRVRGEVEIDEELNEYRIFVEVFCFRDETKIWLQFGAIIERVQGREWVE